jgi:hypothetical protein
VSICPGAQPSSRADSRTHTRPIGSTVATRRSATGSVLAGRGEVPPGVDSACGTRCGQPSRSDGRRRRPPANHVCDLAPPPRRAVPLVLVLWDFAGNSRHAIGVSGHSQSRKTPRTSR